MNSNTVLAAIPHMDNMSLDVYKTDIFHRFSLLQDLQQHFQILPILR